MSLFLRGTYLLEVEVAGWLGPKDRQLSCAGNVAWTVPLSAQGGSSTSLAFDNPLNMRLIKFDNDINEFNRPFP